MGIGISYTSADGRTYGMMADGAKAALSEIQSLSERSAQDAASALRSRRLSLQSGNRQTGGMSNDEYHHLKEMRAEGRRMKSLLHNNAGGQQPAGDPGIVGKAKALGMRIAEIARGLVGFNSSIEESNGKLRLIGDNRVIKSGDVYGKDARGFQGFWPIVDVIEGMDERKIGKRIGNSDSTDLEVQADERNAGDRNPFVESYVTRVVAEKLVDEDEASATYGQTVMTLCAFVRDRMSTGLGRIFGIGKERMLQICRLDTLGGGEQTPGPFEPVFVNGVLDSVGAGLWAYGRQFKSGGGITVDASAKVSAGLIGLEITHVSGSQNASAKVIKISDDDGLMGGITNTDLNKTKIPLYAIRGGKITVDLRCLMALAIRE